MFTKCLVNKEKVLKKKTIGTFKLTNIINIINK